MNIQELVDGLKAKGLGDEEIKVELEKIKTDIDAFIGQSQEPPAVEQPQEPETEEQGLKRVFGL